MYWNGNDDWVYLCLWLSNYCIWVKFWWRVRCNCHFLLLEDRQTLDPLKRRFTWRHFSDDLVLIYIATFQMWQERRCKHGKTDVSDMARPTCQMWQERCCKRGKRDVTNVARLKFQMWQVRRCERGKTNVYLSLCLRDSFLPRLWDLKKKWGYSWQLSLNMPYPMAFIAMKHDLPIFYLLVPNPISENQV
jgi:hypothetical protein